MSIKKLNAFEEYSFEEFDTSENKPLSPLSKVRLVSFNVFKRNIFSR